MNAPIEMSQLLTRSAAADLGRLGWRSIGPDAWRVAGCIEQIDPPAPRMFVVRCRETGALFCAITAGHPWPEPTAEDLAAARGMSLHWLEPPDLSLPPHCG